MAPSGSTCGASPHTTLALTLWHALNLASRPLLQEKLLHFIWLTNISAFSASRGPLTGKLCALAFFNHNRKAPSTLGKADPLKRHLLMFYAAPLLSFSCTFHMPQTVVKLIPQACTTVVFVVPLSVIRTMSNFSFMHSTRMFCPCFGIASLLRMKPSEIFCR